MTKDVLAVCREPDFEIYRGREGKEDDPQICLQDQMEGMPEVFRADTAEYIFERW